MVAVKYKKEEFILTDKVRSLCITNNFYTRGDCEAYEKMFGMCRKYTGNVDDLAHIAWDIVDHSDSEELDDYGFDTVYEIVAWVMSEIAKNCIYTSYRAEEVDE